jgi:hypothetical protein
MSHHRLYDKCISEALVNRERARHERDITTLHTKVLAYKRETTEASLKEKIWFEVSYSLDVFFVPP